MCFESFLSIKYVFLWISTVHLSLANRSFALFTFSAKNHGDSSHIGGQNRPMESCPPIWPPLPWYDWTCKASVHKVGRQHALVCATLIYRSGVCKKKNNTKRICSVEVLGKSYLNFDYTTLFCTSQSRSLEGLQSELNLHEFWTLSFGLYAWDGPHRIGIMLGLLQRW